MPAAYGQLFVGRCLGGACPFSGLLKKLAGTVPADRHPKTENEYFERYCHRTVPGLALAPECE